MSLEVAQRFISYDQTQLTELGIGRREWQNPEECKYTYEDHVLDI